MRQMAHNASADPVSFILLTGKLLNHVVCQVRAEQVSCPRQRKRARRVGVGAFKFEEADRVTCNIHIHEDRNMRTK